MTTAHRPTYNATRGGNIQGSKNLYNPSLQISSKDLPGNLTLKKRHLGQGTREETKKIDYKAELLKRENKHKSLVSAYYEDVNQADESVVDTSFITMDQSGQVASKRLRLDSDISEIKSLPIKSTNEEENVFIQDKDVSFSESEDEQSENEDEDLDSEEELLREYEKIKRMREEENRKKEQETNSRLKQMSQEQILSGNPLISATGDYSLKKKWYEDTVFKNQAKIEPKVRKRFINDTVRSDFHRKFLAKTIQ